MKKKVLLLGASGMAGHVVYYYLKESNRYDITNVVFRQKLTEESIILDVSNKDEVADFVLATKPDIIINCIGILIKGSMNHPDNAILINAYFPHLLKRLSDEVGAKLFHISTDCVFSGKKGAYAENDFRDADDVYGRSKALGEIINDKDVTIRTSIIGPELKKNGEGLFHWFMQQNGEINGFTSAYWGGVTTLELAKAIDTAIINNFSGLLHLTNGEKISKYEMLSLFKKIWQKDAIIIKESEGKNVDKSLISTHEISENIPSYEKMMDEMFEWMQNHPDLYRLYQ
ncbi:MAG: dTDP-4-dehydrorhamnose reductase family protein [Bacteroidales bacterium]